MLELLLKLVKLFLGKNENNTSLEETQSKSKETKVAINWSNSSDKISKYFTVKEALWLPSWGVMHVPSEEEKTQILKMAAIMDLIREIVGSPISVHVWIRPNKANIPGNPNNGGDYNALVKGASSSAHIFGMAVDWSSAGKNCDDLRALLKPKLESLGIRMEDLPGSSWVHTDCKPLAPGGNRFFKP